jgi:putative transposase
MLAIILYVFRFVRRLGSGHQSVAVENLALRLQLAAFQRRRKRPVLTQLDRLIWAALSQVWSGWQRERFRRFWARLSQPKAGHRGRPGIAAEIRQLVLRMAAANPLWRAPRIHGELKMLGITISERTVS